MASEEEYRKARDNAAIKFKEAWDACLEFALLHGLPNDLPNYDLEVKRAYAEIETLQETITARDEKIVSLMEGIEILMSKPQEPIEKIKINNIFQTWWYQSRLYKVFWSCWR